VWLVDVEVCMDKSTKSKRNTQKDNWKQNRVLHATTVTILDIVEEFTFVDDGHLVGPTSDQVRQELPFEASLAEVEGHLALLTEFGLLGTDQCACGNCGSRIYFHVCENGVPLILHNTSTVN